MPIILMHLALSVNVKAAKWRKKILLLVNVGIIILYLNAHRMNSRVPCPTPCIKYLICKSVRCSGSKGSVVRLTHSTQFCLLHIYILRTICAPSAIVESRHLLVYHCQNFNTVVLAFNQNVRLFREEMVEKQI